jgi:phenylacetate-CoA ligase
MRRPLLDGTRGRQKGQHMRTGYAFKRLQDAARAFFIQRKLDAHERWTREELLRYQRERLSLLVAHAARHSPFYRELYGNIRTNRGILIEDLPIIDKSAMMDNFDRFVTDPRLKLSELQAHVGRLTRDEYYRGEYRVTTTSGSSGMKGVFVFDRKEWSTALAGLIRCGSYVGVSPSLLRRWKISTIAADSPAHVTDRMSESIDVGLTRAQRLSATSGIRDLAGALNAFQPELLGAYPSIAALLAEEQREGRLDIHPRVVATFAEMRTGDMQRKIQESWGVVPFNAYGMTEAGIAVGVDCSLHRGMHVFEDLVILEVVDERNNAVSDGSPGHKLLVTNLFNFTQPIIRYEVSDMLTMSRAPCPCGRPFRLIAAVEGRSDDIVYLRGAGGGDVPVHPNHFHDILETLEEIKQYQVVHEEKGITISAVLRPGAPGEEAANKVRERLRAALQSLGALCPDIHVRFVDGIPRDARQMGKLKLVRSNISVESMT